MSVNKNVLAIKNKKRRLGIYIGYIEPHFGGGYSFVEGVIEGMLQHQNLNYDISILYYGKRRKSSDRRFLWVCLNKNIGHKIRDLICKWQIRLNTNKTVQSAFEIICKKHSISLLWMINPDYTVIRTIPYLYTLWDIGHKIIPYFPEVSKNGEWEMRERINQVMLRRASRIIVGNETGKRDLLRHYHVEPDFIKIIPFAVTKLTEEPKVLPAIAELKVPFLFYPAQFWAHKNHVTALKMIAWLKKENINVNIVFTGADYGNLQYVKKYSRTLQVEKSVHFLGFVSRAELVWLYKNALALTYFSALGPNNLPPLEALSFGCPAIVSDLEGHREQLGSSVLYASLYDDQDWGRKVVEVMTRPEERELLVQQGLLRIQGLTYKNYVKSAMDILDELSNVRDVWD